MRQIVINDHRKIHAIQDEFSEMFPFLKLEFFNKPHRVGAASSKRVKKASGRTIGDCRIVHKKGVLTLSPEMTVSDIEDSFRDVYGITVQVLRKSGKAWLETSVTDGWTLSKQNEQGKALEQKLAS